MAPIQSLAPILQLIDACMAIDFHVLTFRVRIPVKEGERLMASRLTALSI